MKSTTPALLLTFVLVFAACGGDDGSTTTTEGANAAPTVVIEGFAFSEVGEAAVGEEIVVANRDSTGHTWTAADGSFDSGTISGGETFAFTFDAPGEYSFFCGIHPTMTGSITVTG